MSLFTLACTGMLLQPMAMAAPQPAQSIVDIALQNDGALVGLIANSSAQPIAKTRVSIIQRGKEVAQVTTNQKGHFKVSGLQGGVYQIATVGQQGVFRLWAPQTAPPSAQKKLNVITGQVVRGQGDSSAFSKFAGWVTTHPIITGGIVAAAIAIPLAIDANDDDPSS